MSTKYILKLTLAKYKVNSDKSAKFQIFIAS